MAVQYQFYKEADLDSLVAFYVGYYNSKGGSWTYEKAAKRIGQIASMKDSLIILQLDGKGLVGFLMGYFKQFDDSVGFFLEEILISEACQNQGYGTALLSYLKIYLKKQGCAWIELLTTKGAEHQNFYQKNGYQISSQLVLEFLDL